MPIDFWGLCSQQSRIFFCITTPIIKAFYFCFVARSGVEKARLTARLHPLCILKTNASNQVSMDVRITINEAVLADLFCCVFTWNCILDICLWRKTGLIYHAYEEATSI
jgi:hypothetical protein